MMLKFTKVKVRSIAGILKKNILLAFLLLLFTQTVSAADLYWIGGSGDWADLQHWSLTSGNTGGIRSTSIPQAGDNVIFDANSGFTAASKTVNVNQSSICNNFTVLGSAVSPTFSGTNVDVYGTANYQTGTVLNNTIYFKGSTANTISFNGGVSGTAIIFFQGAGSWAVSGTLNSTGKIYFLQGSLNFGSSNITTSFFDEGGCCGSVPSLPVEPRTLNLGSSIITLTDRNSQGNSRSWNYAGTNLNAGTSQINLTRGIDNSSGVTFNGKSGHVYYNVNFTGTTTSSYSYSMAAGGCTFNTLTFAAGLAEISPNCTIGTLNLAKSTTCYVYGVQKINTINNPTADCEALWTLSGGSSQATITSANPITLSNLKLNFIKISGTGPFVANNAIDLGNNFGWTFNVVPKNLYWIGGGGNWNDPTHWTTNADGTPITGGCVPTRNDNVFFNSFSGAISALAPVIINTTDAECQNLTWAGVPGTPLFQTASGGSLNIYGSTTLQTGMLYQVGTTNYRSATLGNTITSNGASILGDTFFLGLGGWSFNDAFLSPANDISFLSGTLNTNNQSVTVRDFGKVGAGNSVRTLNLGSSIITVNRNWAYTKYFGVPAINLNAGTSQINLTANGAIFYFDSNANLNFYNLAFLNTAGSASITNTLGSQATISFNTVTFAGGGSINTGFNIATLIINNLNLAPSKKYLFGTLKETKVLNLNASTPDCVPLLEISSGIPGTQANLNLVNPATITNAKITDINANGANLTVAGGIDGGNNLNIAITPIVPRNFYWIGGTGNWNDPVHWTLNNDGTINPSGGCLPGAIDNVFFNQYSGTSYTVTIDNSSNCNNMTWEEVAGSIPTLKGLLANPLNINGSLVLQTGMDVDLERLNFVSNSALNSIVTHGVVLDYSASNQPSKGVFFWGSGAWTLNDTFNVKNFGVKNGTLNTNNQLVNVENYISEYTNGAVNPILNLGSSIINVAGYWNGNAIKILNAGTSIINMNATLSSANNNGGGIITGNFDAGTGLIYRDLNFTNPTVLGTIYGFSATTGSTFNNVSFSSDATIGNANTFNTITFAPNKTATLMYGATQSVGSIINNTNCGLWELKISSAGGQKGVIKSTNDITFNNAKISDISCIGGGIFKAVGIDNGNNTGISFTSPTGTNLYWIGGSGNWTDPTHWTTNSNGTSSGGSCIPTRFDNVFFNQYSGNSPGINIVGGAEFHDMTWDGVTGSPLMNGTFSCYGSMTLQSTLLHSGGVNFLSSETGKTIKANGAIVASNFDVYFSGTGSYTLLDDFSANSNIHFTAGTLNTNGKTVNVSAFVDENNNLPGNSTRSLILGASEIRVGIWTYTGAALDAGTSHIYLSRSQTDFTAKDGAVYHAITFDPDANGVSHLYNSITVDELVFSPKNSIYQIGAGKTITVNNSMQMSGTNCLTTTVQSTMPGTRANLCVSGASNSTFNFISIQDINASCTPLVFLPQTTNAGNNVNITFKPNLGGGIGALGADKVICQTALPILLDASDFVPNANTTFQWRNVTTNTNLGTSVTQSITAGGTYRVTVNYGVGCVVTDDIIIKANPIAQTAEIVADDIVNCPGTPSSTLKAALSTISTLTNPVFSWYADEAATVALGTGATIVVSPTVATSYWVTVKGDNECVSSVKRVEVTFGNPAKPVVSAGGPTTVCPSGSVVLTSSALTGNQWYKNGNAIAGETGQTYTVTLAGSYTVVFNAGNCASSPSDAAVITVEDVTAPVVPVLAAVTGECSVTVTAPTTTDNCSGTITGITTDPLTYTAQGNYTINWTFTDAAGNSSTATQNVTVKDVTAPAVPVLATVSGECSATVTAPTTTDNCSGTITGITTDPLTYTAQGNYTINWTFTDAAGNSSTATQNVTVKDVTAPAVPVLATVSGECSATVTAPTTTDNCSGTITGITTDPLTYTAQGNYTINWTFTDAAGNSSTATQNVTVKDVTAPAVPVLATVSGECSATVTAPTTTDNCSGTITGITTDPLTYTAQGNYTINWTFTDAAGNSSTATQNVTVKDVTAPAVPVLATVSGECSATVTAPTTTDNCSGTITGITTDPLTYTAQGNYTVNWTFTDGAGNSSTATQNVIVKDVTKPIIPVLATVTGECSATVTAPTTTDNCSGTITGTTTDPLTYTAQGNYTINWTFTDAAGNSSTATQNVIVKDVTKPVVPVLATVTGECSATVTAPTTIDNCSGTITGTTTDPLTYTAQGNYTINWTFTDAAGNSSTATQNVIVKDVTKPVVPVLATVNGECSATVTAPTTTDNCSGTITGTTTDPLTYTAQGNYTINWTFTDAAGNSSTATQNVIVKDVTKPVVPVLATVNGECSATVTAPTTTDNCSGTITGITTDPLTYTAQGNYTINWTFTDAAGNSSNATQNVIVKDVTKPIIPVLATVTGECSATVTAPTTTDNCSGTITGITTDPLTYTAQGNYTINWTFTDAAGNSSTATQNVIVKDVTKPVVPVLATVNGECSATVTAPTTTDNCSGTITGTTTDPLTYTAEGNYTITWTFADAAGNSSIAQQKVILTNIKAPIVSITSQPSCSVATGNISITPVTGVTYSIDGGAYSANISYLLTAGDHIVRAKSVNGCISDLTRVTINPQPAGPTATIAYAQLEYQATSTGNVILTGQAGGTFTSSPAGLSINTTTGAIDFGLSTPNQTYTITYNFSNGSCSGTTTTTVKINSVPATINYAQSIFCASGTASVTRVGPTGGTFTSNSSGLKINASTGEINLSSSAVGNYVVTYDYKNGSLRATTGTTVTINALPIIRITSDLGLEISKGDVAVLTATGGLNYSWTGTDMQAGQNTSVLKVRPRETTTYTVVATNANGCSDVMRITIKVIEDRKLIPNTVITPNGDGKNDTWVIKNIDYYPNNKVTIYDRAGRLIYTKKGYANDWDGMLNGNPLHEDAYFYVIDMGTGVGLIKGTVSIIRDRY